MLDKLPNDVSLGCFTMEDCRVHNHKARRAFGAPARLMTAVEPFTASFHRLGPKTSTLGYGSFPEAAFGFLVSTLTLWPCDVSLLTSLVPTRPVAPATRQSITSIK